MTIRRAPALAPSREPPCQPGNFASAVPERLVKPWKLPPQMTYVLKNASIVDPARGTVHARQTVRLCGGIIESIESTNRDDDDDDASLTASAIVVDLEGRYLCPGLIDCHVHLSAVAGEPSLDGGMGSDATVSHFRQPFLCAQMLGRGFTTVRDTGGATLALKEALADDVFPGPRLFISNKALSQTGGHGDHRAAHDHSCCGGGIISAVCDGVPGCTVAAREQLRTGADFIKIMVGGGVASPTDRLENTQFTAAELQAITEVAASYGTFVTAHAYTPQAIRHAGDNGVRGIEHGNLMDEETARYMAAKQMWLTPTLVTYEAMGSDKYAGFLPPASAAKNQQVLARGLDALRLAHAAGVTICHGSDLLGPLQAEQSREFAIRARALDSLTVLRGATVNAARMLGQERFLGQISEGFAADMLVMEADPLEDITILAEPHESVAVVIKDGRVCVSRWEKMVQDVRAGQPLMEY